MSENDAQELAQMVRDVGLNAVARQVWVQRRHDYRWGVRVFAPGVTNPGPNTKGYTTTLFDSTVWGDLAQRATIIRLATAADTRVGVKQ